MNKQHNLKHLILSICQGELKHLRLFLFWPLFLLEFIVVERFTPAENFFAIHCILDDFIPFCEIFIIPYMFWYVYIAGMLFYLAFTDCKLFEKLMRYIGFAATAALVVFIVFPNCQNMRVTEFANQNIFTDMVKFIYTIDTNTNVCPSLHVLFSVAVLSAALKIKKAGAVFKTVMAAMCVLICISTVFVKQHSVIDIIAALPVCLLAEIMVFRKNKLV